MNVPLLLVKYYYLKSVDCYSRRRSLKEANKMANFHGIMNKEELTYPQNGEAATVTGSAGSIKNKSKLHRNFLLLHSGNISVTIKSVISFLPVEVCFCSRQTLRFHHIVTT